MSDLRLVIGDKDSYPDIIEYDGFKTSVWVVPKDVKLYFKGSVSPDETINVVSLNENDTFEVFQKGYFGYIRPNQDSKILFLQCLRDA